MIDTVVFDMDGLLINSEPLWVEGMQEVLATVGVEITPELAVQTTGLRTSEVIAYWHDYFQWNHKSREQVAEEIIETVSYKIAQEGHLMEGIPYILDFFQNRGLKMGLASSSPLQFIEQALTHFGIRGYFSTVSSAEYEPYGKPHPAVYLSCLQQLGSQPLKSMAFEDSVNGMIAAKAARMKVVVVPEPHNRQNPRYILADLQLSSLQEFTTNHLEALGS